MMLFWKMKISRKTRLFVKRRRMKVGQMKVTTWHEPCKQALVDVVKRFEGQKTWALDRNSRQKCCQAQKCCFSKWNSVEKEVLFFLNRKKTRWEEKKYCIERERSCKEHERVWNVGKQPPNLLLYNFSSPPLLTSPLLMSCVLISLNRFLALDFVHNFFLI